MRNLTLEHIELVRQRSLLLAQFSKNGCNPVQEYSLSVEVRRRRSEIKRLAGFLEAIWNATPPDQEGSPMFEDRLARFGRVQEAYEAECELVVALEDVLFDQCRLRVRDE